MECKKIKALISPYLDEELSPAEMETVRIHLDNCHECRQEFEEIRDISVALKDFAGDTLAAPAGFSDSVMRSIKEEAAASESHTPLFRGQGIRRWAAGIAAALVIALSAAGINWGPLLQIADNTPDNPTEINTPVQPGENSSNLFENNNNLVLPVPPDNESNPASGDSENTGNNVNPAVPANQGNDVITTPEENRANNTYEADATLLSTAPVIKTSMLRIEADDSAATLAEVLETASGNVKTVQKVNEDGCTIVKMTVPVSEAANLIARFADMGKILANQEDEKDVAAGYTDSLEQYRNLINQYNNSSDAGEQRQLKKQIESLEIQLSNWQKEAEKQTIVLIVQQK